MCVHFLTLHSILFARVWLALSLAPSLRAAHWTGHTNASLLAVTSTEKTKTCGLFYETNLLNPTRPKQGEQVANGDQNIFGLMIESNLKEGNQVCACACACACVCVRVRVRVCECVCVCVRLACGCAHARKPCKPRTNADCVRACVRTRTEEHPSTNHPYAHAHTQVRTHTNAHTHVRTHTDTPPLPHIQSFNSRTTRSYTQKLGLEGAAGLVYGQSITDACVILEQTEPMLTKTECFNAPTTSQTHTHTYTRLPTCAPTPTRTHSHRNLGPRGLRGWCTVSPSRTRASTWSRRSPCLRCWRRPFVTGVGQRRE